MTLLTIIYLHISLGNKRILLEHSQTIVLVKLQFFKLPGYLPFLIVTCLL
jgi:hypothetical protein